jgi:hypothetical protein
MRQVLILLSDAVTTTGSPQYHGSTSTSSDTRSIGSVSEEALSILIVAIAEDQEIDGISPRDP